MTPGWWSKAEKDIHQAIQDFTDKLKAKLDEPPRKIIERKNPFLFRIRVVSDAHELARMVTNAYLSSSEETIFGNVLEDIAISVCAHAKDGRKSGISKIDLEYDVGTTRTIVQIKSGTNWGNSSQHKAMREAFKDAKIVLRQGSANLSVRAVEGICYGRSQIQDKGNHFRIVGHCFWEEISGWGGTASHVMDLLGQHSSNGLHDVREVARMRLVDYLRKEGIVDSNDNVIWERLLSLVLASRGGSVAG